ncbi:MAG: IS21-like element helper ATPase IstB [Gammaproteobacteria bacterium]
MLINQTKQHLLQLGLKGMHSAFEIQQQQPDIQRLSFEDRFSMLVDAEVNDRDSRKIERIKRSAKLRQNRACIEDIDYHPSRKLDQSLIMSLANCSWIDRHQNLIITGATGTGKSWMTCAIADQACRKKYSTYYTTATQLFEDLSRAQVDGTMIKFRRMLVRTQLLIIDDLGIGGIDNSLGPILLDIIDMQSQNGALLIASQYPTKKWYDLFNDPTIADAVLDRIVHQAHFLQLHGESLRKTRKKT